MSSVSAVDQGPIRVVVWDERQPRQQQAYDNFLGNEIAACLKSRGGLAVRSVRLDDPEQGLSVATLDSCEVLIWWGHARHAEITPETGREIVARISSGRLSLIALHSAHWSTPFVEAMHERTRRDAAQRFPDSGAEQVELEFVPPLRRYAAPVKDSPLTPSYYPRKYPGGITRVRVELPNCCFPGNRADAKPGYLNTVLSDHPIAIGIPGAFSIPQTEMYDEPFHVPDPDQVIFEERWPTGEWFRSGTVWEIGGGKLFYFRPGHETYPIFKQQIPLRIIDNAVRWLGEEMRRGHPRPA